MTVSRYVIRLVCPDCNEQPVTADQAQIVMNDWAAPTSYRFTCPSCCARVTCRATDAWVSLLAAAGVQTVVEHIPRELLELHHGPPLDHDDLLELCLQLGTTDLLAWLAAW